MKKLTNLILEQLTRIINTKDDIDDDIKAFGLYVSSKDQEDGYYSYVVSGDPDQLLRLIMHVSGPGSVENDNTLIAPVSFGGGSDDWGVW